MLYMAMALEGMVWGLWFSRDSIGGRARERYAEIHDLSGVRRGEADLRGSTDVFG